MKRTLPLLLLATLVVTGCSNNETPTSTTEPAPTTTETPAPRKYGFYELKDGVDESTLHGSPWLNTSIIGMANKVNKPSLKDDFFTSANYDVLTSNVIPEGSSKGGGFLYSTDKLVKERLNEIMDSNETFLLLKEAMKVGNKDQIKAEIDAILAMNESQFSNYASSVEFVRGSSAFISMTSDKGLPTLGYINDAKNINIATVVAMLLFYQKADMLPPILEEIGVMIGFERSEIAQIIADSFQTLLGLGATVLGTTSSVTHETEVKLLDTEFPNVVGAKNIFKTLGLNDDDKVGYTDLAFNIATFIQNLYKNAEDFPILKKLVVLTKLFENRFFLGAEDVKTLYLTKFANTPLADSNITQESSLDDVAKYFANIIFQQVVERDYCEKYITKEARNKTKQIINDVVAGFTTVLEENDWLSDETKQKALEKMAAMKFEAFYSDEYENYEPFTYVPTDLVSSYDNYLDYYIDGLLANAFSSDELHVSMPVTTVNAAYLPTTNSFRIYHGIVASFIDDELTKEELYGRIGTIIGHEITHGFDSTGSQYDKDGHINNWWTIEDSKTFQEKINKIIDFYENKIDILNDGTKMVGASLTGEIIADMGGMKTMIEMGKKINGFDWDKFFKNDAIFYNYSYTEQAVRDAIKNDPHPISYLRVNVTMAQFDKFQETYDIKVGDGMYIDTKDRIAIW